MREVGVFGPWVRFGVVVGDAVVEREMNAEEGGREGGVCASAKDTLLQGSQKKKKSGLSV